jgi:tetratricopeptide (TPR) repeat protein
MHWLPHGPLASEYYSIAKLAGRDKDIFDLALTHIQLAIESNSGNTANQTAIRASIFLRTGRAAAALEDYERVAELRRESGGPAYGEALSEWGYGMLGTKKKTKGVTKMEEGLELLRSAPPSGFQVRAMKKLAEGYARSWKLGAALDLVAEAVDVAEAIGARDQIRTLERLARYLTKR